MTVRRSVVVLQDSAVEFRENLDNKLVIVDKLVRWKELIGVVQSFRGLCPGRTKSLVCSGEFHRKRVWTPEIVRPGKFVECSR
jgi:hypothetical protein